MNNRFYFIFPAMAMILILYFIYPISANDKVVVYNGGDPYYDGWCDYGTVYALEELEEKGYDTNVMTMDSIIQFSNDRNFILYDANFDGAVNVLDLILVKNHILGKHLLSSEQIIRITGEEDSSSITIVYLLYIKAYIFGTDIPENNLDYSVYAFYSKCIFFILALVSGMILFKFFTDNWNHIKVKA